MLVSVESALEVGAIFVLDYPAAVSNTTLAAVPTAVP